MEQIHSELNLETKSFTMPDSIVSEKICTKSGKLAVEGLCDQYIGGDTTKIEYFAKGTEPTEKCDIHVKAIICTESNAKATENCPAEVLKEAVYLSKTGVGYTNDTPYILPSASCLIHKKIKEIEIPVEEVPTITLIPEDDIYEDEVIDDNIDLDLSRQILFQ